MTASNQVMVQPHQIDGAIMEKVVLENDLAKLSPMDKVKYVAGVCKSLGLNPATNPIKLMKFQGKEILYFSKESTEQLRKTNHVSIDSIESKTMDGIYIVTAHATTPDGRKDASTGAIMIKGLQGADLCNAIMKAETKAKRRVTLSICGLGFSDESEMDTMKGASKVNLDAHRQAAENQKLVTQEIKESEVSLDIMNEDDFNEFMDHTKKSETLEDLRSIYGAYKHLKAKPEYIKALVSAGEERKMQIMAKKMDSMETENINPDTGEVE